MTDQVSPPGDLVKSSDLTILALHGLVRQNTEPEQQLLKMRQALESELQPRKVTWIDCLWTTDDPLVKRFGPSVAPIIHLKKNTFCRTYEQYFTKEGLEPLLESSEPVAIIAYSAGGLIIYDWLAKHNLPTDVAVVGVDRIAKVFCLASPYQVPANKTIYITPLPGEPTVVITGIQEDSILPEEIITPLRSAQLIALLAEDDITVRDDMGTFSETIQETQLVEQHVIPGVDHLSILEPYVTDKKNNQRPSETLLHILKHLT